MTGQQGGFLCVNIQSSLRLGPPVALARFHPPSPCHVDGVSVVSKLLLKPSQPWTIRIRQRTTGLRACRQAQGTSFAREACGCVRTFCHFCTVPICCSASLFFFFNPPFLRLNKTLIIVIHIMTVITVINKSHCNLWDLISN